MSAKGSRATTQQPPMRAGTARKSVAAEEAERAKARSGMREAETCHLQSVLHQRDDTELNGYMLPFMVRRLFVSFAFRCNSVPVAHNVCSGALLL
jgi:hypothetical protein